MILGDDPIAVLHQINQEVEYLWLEREGPCSHALIRAAQHQACTKPQIIRHSKNTEFVVNQGRKIHEVT